MLHDWTRHVFSLFAGAVVTLGKHAFDRYMKQKESRRAERRAEQERQRAEHEERHRKHEALLNHHHVRLSVIERSKQ